MRVTSPAVTIKDIWDALVADYGIAGSYGLLLETNLDAKVSLAKADLTTLETRLSAARATKLDNLDALLSSLGIYAVDPHEDATEYTHNTTTYTTKKTWVVTVPAGEFWRIRTIVFSRDAKSDDGDPYTCYSKLVFETVDYGANYTMATDWVPLKDVDEDLNVLLGEGNYNLELQMNSSHAAHVERIKNSEVYLIYERYT